MTIYRRLLYAIFVHAILKLFEFFGCFHFLCGCDRQAGLTAILTDLFPHVVNRVWKFCENWSSVHWMSINIALVVHFLPHLFLNLLYVEWLRLFSTFEYGTLLFGSVAFFCPETIDTILEVNVFSSKIQEAANLLRKSKPVPWLEKMLIQKWITLDRVRG